MHWGAHRVDRANLKGVGVHEKGTPSEEQKGWEELGRRGGVLGCEPGKLPRRAFSRVAPILWNCLPRKPNRPPLSLQEGGWNLP